MDNKYKLSNDEIKAIHYALFWIKDLLGSALDSSYPAAELSVSNTIKALSNIIIEHSDMNMNLSQFMCLFKDKWQHVNYLMMDNNNDSVNKSDFIV